MQLAAEGTKVAALETRPVLHPIHNELWDGFNILSASRQTGMGVGYIPLTEICCYASVIGYTRTQDFIAIIRAMDDVFVKWQNDKTDNGHRDVGSDD